MFQKKQRLFCFKTQSDKISLHRFPPAGFRFKTLCGFKKCLHAFQEQVCSAALKNFDNEISAGRERCLGVFNHCFRKLEGTGGINYVAARGVWSGIADYQAVRAL